VRYGSTSAIAAQLLAEGADSPADLVLLQDAGALGALGDADCLADLPQEITGQTFAEYADEDGRWVPLTGRARVVVHNPALIAGSDLPDTTADLADPRYAGQIGIAPGNASFQAFVTTMRVLEGEEATEEFLRGLVDNDVQVFDGNNDILDAVDAGQLAMGLVNHYYWFEKAAEVGAENVTAQVAYLQDGAAGSLVNVSGAGIVSSTDRQAEAAELLEFLLSEEAQTYFAEETHEYPMIEAVAAEPELPALTELEAPDIDLDDMASLSQTLDLLDRVGLT
jgi:iron(III) transport system substrate-binding protein